MSWSEDKALVAAWAIVPLAEIWFARQGFATPAWWQITGELVLFALLAANHLHFAPRGWMRSALWPGMVASFVLLIALAPGNGATRAVFAVGAAVLLGGAVWAVQQVFDVRWTGVAFGALTVVLGRWGVLAWTGGGRDTVDDPRGQLMAELQPTTPAGSGSDAPPVVLITIDTLRWDHLVEMDSYQRIAARGRAWDRAMSTSSWTLPSMASIHTGLAPRDHGASSRSGGGYSAIDADVERLSVALADAGYTTGAVFSNAWLLPGLGFREGFHHYWHVNQSRPHRLTFTGAPLSVPWQAEAVSDRGLAVLDRLPDEGAFLWVHYVDPHLPFGHAEGLAAGVEEGRLRQGMIRDDELEQAVREAYAGEVAWMDPHLMRLLDGIEARGWFDRGLVILTSDHGEELFDHGSAEHGHSHHGEVVDVGLAIAGPGVAIGTGYGVPSLIDVHATIRAVAGLPAVGEGLDLRRPLPKDRIAEAFGNAYEGMGRSTRRGSLRVIVEPDGRIHAYDLATDPDEQRPLHLSPEHPVVQAALAIEGPSDREAADINTEALEALGYIE